MIIDTTLQVSLLQHWRDTFTRFAPDMTVHIHASGASENSPSAAADVVITTASMLLQPRSTFLRQCAYWRLIVDEAHLVSNPNTQIYKALSSLRSAHVWCVTGTPLQKNDSDDMRALLQLCGVGWAMLPKKDSAKAAKG